jgi:glycosyltransferase involved in cell wall biosynthesis
MSTHTDFPLISIITVVFNNVNTIEKTILSVINQSYKNIEYIIIDGGSTDGTLTIINNYRSYISTIVSEKDNGIADAMNKGIALATGNLIGLINADDWFEPDAINKVARVNSQYPDSIIHGSMRVYFNSSTFYLETAVAKPNLKKGMELNHPTVFVPAVLYKEYGLFDTNYRIVFDWELMLRFKISGVNFIKIDDVISNFSVGGVSTTQSKELIEEMHLIRKKNRLYKLLDRYYIINKIRSIFFGANVIKISQKLRLIKYKLRNINF